MIKYNPVLKYINETGIYWDILINDECFNYFQGIGHLKTSREEKSHRFTIRDHELELKIARALNYSGKRLTMQDISSIYYYKEPLVDDVLHCLFLDAQASSASFYDWCSEFGYSSDSIEALKTYHKCQENETKLKKALGKEYYKQKERVEALDL